LSRAKPPEEFVEALSNDLNTSLALTLINKYLKNNQELELVGALQLLGFDPDKLKAEFMPFRADAFDNGGVQGHGITTQGPEAQGHADLIKQLNAELTRLRQVAMETKDFAPVDAMKAALVAAGVEVRMSKAGVELLPGVGFDAAKLPPL
jgi:cysteinyl-tRNA synthetase